MSIYTASLAAKRLELARELVADPRFVAVLTNPASPTLRAELANVETAARERGQRILVLNSSVDEDLETSFAEMVSQQAGVLLLLQDGFFNSRRERIIRLAARHRVPAVYYERVFARAGGLLSYGASIAEGYRHAGRYSGLILKGASPADLPVLQPTKFELVINLETARAIGLQIQPSLLVRADEVIE